jgi:hypothetical protein
MILEVLLKIIESLTETPCCICLILMHEVCVGPLSRHNGWESVGMDLQNCARYRSRIRPFRITHLKMQCSYATSVRFKVLQRRSRTSELINYDGYGRRRWRFLITRAPMAISEVQVWEEGILFKSFALFTTPKLHQCLQRFTVQPEKHYTTIGSFFFNIFFNLLIYRFSK